jgi:hypothetical protein
MFVRTSTKVILFTAVRSKRRRNAADNPATENQQQDRSRKTRPLRTAGVKI